MFQKLFVDAVILNIYIFTTICLDGSCDHACNIVRWTVAGIQTPEKPGEPTRL